MGVHDFFSPEAGQRRRKWLNRVDDKLQGLMEYYMGPDLSPPVMGLINAVGFLSDGQDFIDTKQAGDKLMGSRSIPEAVTNFAEFAAPAAAVMIPGISNRMIQGGADVAQDAARFVRDESGVLYTRRAGATVDDVVDFAKRGDGIFHSGTADAASDIHKYGVEPQHGPWVREVLEGSTDDEDLINEIIENSPPAAWWSEQPDWVGSKVSRKTGVSNPNFDQIAKDGHLSIASRSDYADDAFLVGPGGVDGPRSMVETLDGTPKRFYETPLFSHENGRDYQTFGIERDEIITGETIVPEFTLTGPELVEFLKKYDGDGIPDEGLISILSKNGEPVKTLSPAEEQARGVLDMVTSGRGADVTDEMLAAADDQYLFKNYDLPMDEASRMARAEEMGFMDNYETYHGTGDDIQAFRSSFRSDPGQDDAYRVGVYSAYRPDIAQTYSPVMRDGQIYPLATRRTIQDVEIDAQGRNWNDIEMDSPAYIPGDRDDAVISDYWPGADDGDGLTRTNALAREAMRDGAGSLKINNTYDIGGNKDIMKDFDSYGPHDIRTDFYPRNIRSRFARFDPRLSHLSNLSAGVGGLGLYGLLNELLQDQEQGLQ